MTLWPCLRQAWAERKTRPSGFSPSGKNGHLLPSILISAILSDTLPPTPPASFGCALGLQPNQSSQHCLMEQYASSPIFPWKGKLWWSNPAAFAFVESGPSNFRKAGLIWPGLRKTFAAICQRKCFWHVFTARRCLLLPIPSHCKTSQSTFNEYFLLFG
jgi:hypothetical protein